MKQLQAILIGLILTINGYSQSVIKVQTLSSKYASRTNMIIPHEDRFLYESYSNFHSAYWALGQLDTLTLINDSILKGNEVLINLNLYTKTCDFCDTTINFIRNSALRHRLFSMSYDTCMKYIGWTTEEIDEYIMRTIYIDQNLYKTCSDKFVDIVYNRFYKVNRFFKEMYNRKKDCTDWIRNNPEKVDQSFIRSFLIDFNYNTPDKESFIEIVIANPAELISQINKLDDPFRIILGTYNLPKHERLNEAIFILENGKFRGKTYRQILRRMKKNES